MTEPDSDHAARDPVCGMRVDPATAKHRHDYRGTTHYFCGARCREKFIAEPEKYLNPPPAGPAARPAPPAAPAGVPWTCPMHPEIVRDGPGACPKCGMELEPASVTAADAPNPALIDMSRRFRIELT